MKFTLRYDGEAIGKEPLDNGTYQIGRHTGKANVTIRGPGFEENGTVIGESDIINLVISRKHLEMEVSDERLTLRDLGSMNGSYIDGKQFNETEVKKSGRCLLTLGRNFSLEFITSE